MNETIRLTEQDHFLTVTLSRPQMRNAFDPHMIAELTATFRSVVGRQDLKGILLRGEGKAFCAGADLNYMKRMVDFTFEENQKDADVLYEMYEVIKACHLPVLAVVQGAAFGGGLGLIAVCDYVIAEEQTQFCFSEVKLGLVPAVISPFVLSKVPRGQVAPYMLSGKTFSAAQALQMGLVHEVAIESDLLDSMESMVTRFQAAGSHAIAATKELLAKLPNLTEDQVRGETTHVIAERRASTEGQEGLKSFLEKRSPAWQK